MSRDAEMASVGYAKSPFDWYVEPFWAVTGLVASEMITLPSAVGGSFGHVYDPCAGRGTIPQTFRSLGMRADGSDIEYRGCPGALGHVYDFLEPGVAEDVIAKGLIGTKGKLLSIISNPPYSYKRGICEAIIRRALGLASAKVCMLIPVKVQAYQWFHRLCAEHCPSRIWIMSERPSMPPGAEIERLGAKAFTRGKVDYMWVVWEMRAPAAVTEWRTIAPRALEARK
jgi:hypothetical protein